MSLLFIDNLKKTFPGKNQSILNNINFSLEAGEKLAIMGQSGSGKSTLLSMVAGKESWDEGSIRINDKELQPPDQLLIPGHPSVKLVHQHFELKHKMSVRDNITSHLRDYQKSYQEERSLHLLKQFNLLGAADQLVEQISGGEKQRLALANAMADEPELLLLDESFSQVDRLTKEFLLDELFSMISEENTAIIFVTHDPQDAFRVADYLGILNQGSLVKIHALKKEFFVPLNTYEASIVGNYNLLTDKDLNTLDYSNAPMKNYCLAYVSIRYEAKEGGQWSVEDCFFDGRSYLVSARHKNGVLLRFFNHKPLKTRNKVNLSWDPSSLKVLED